ncbi:toxin-antitoxin system YwqK family antitoxin [Flavobacterium faecale]|uniref:toxin-antitoxin system YwqK family antitoxin n=1 Tax=Flavobacterium faecale TaxID=1355330 RepID=UPI001FE8DA41|nr:toxin-antitoxin system YwqK family antitoxin [Flavobacterium faecale]
MIIKELQKQFNSKFAIVVLAFCLFSCKHNGENLLGSNVAILKVNKEDLQLLPEKGLVFYKSKPFTGVSQQFYENGKLSEIGTFKDGIEDGPYKKWFPNGLLGFESNYVKGTIDGVSKSWWNNGKLRTKSNFKMGVGDGVQMQYYISGSKFKMITIKDGQQNGMQKAWRENGKIYSNYEAKNGRIFGLKRVNLCYELENEKVKE